MLDHLLSYTMAKIIREETEKLYCESFQPEDYVNTYYKSLDHEVEFFLTNLHNYFSSKGIVQTKCLVYIQNLYECRYTTCSFRYIITALDLPLILNE